MGGGLVDAFDAQRLGLVDGVGRVIGPGAPLLELAVLVEEGVEEGVVVAGIGQVDGDGLRLRAGRVGLGRGDVEDRAAAMAARSVSVRGAGPGRIPSA